MAQGKAIEDVTVDKIKAMAKAGEQPVQIACDCAVSLKTVYKYAGDIIKDKSEK